MENINKNRPIVRFSVPDPITNSIVVSRVLSDDNIEPIGKIYPNYGNEEDSAMYVSANNHGEVLFPATSDFVDLENKFEKYSKELTENSLTDEFEEREESIKGLRRWQIKLKTKLIYR